MKCPLHALCLALAAALLLPASGKAQTGVLLKTFDLKAEKLLLDPNRSQLYATLPADGGIGVVNTAINTVAATLRTGANPVDLAISLDGTRLYVLNSDYTTASIAVVDLTTLTVLPSLPAPFAGSAIAAGPGNRLYVLGESGDPGADTGIAQLDATTGALEGMLPQATVDNFGNSMQVTYVAGNLRISPDGNTLYTCASVGSPIVSFDISTATPTVLQAVALEGDSESLPISHNGQYLVLGSAADFVSTWLIPTSDLNAIAGTFSTGSYLGPAAFSADDSLLYQVQLGLTSGHGNTLKIFSTATFDLLTSFVLPSPGVTMDDNLRVTDLVATAPNGYLYVASGNGGAQPPFNLLLASTQTAPFLDGSVPLSDGFRYLQFPDGNLFGYYNLNANPYLYHSDLGFEYPFDAADNSGGIYLYDFKSGSFFYTSPSLFPYLYDFTLNSFLYYYPDTTLAGHYTSNPRYFYDFATSEIITK